MKTLSVYWFKYYDESIEGERNKYQRMDIAADDPISALKMGMDSLKQDQRFTELEVTNFTVLVSCA